MTARLAAALELTEQIHRLDIQECLCEGRDGHLHRRQLYNTHIHTPCSDRPLPTWTVQAHSTVPTPVRFFHFLVISFKYYL